MPRNVSPEDKSLILCQIPILWEQYVSFNIKRLRNSAEVKKDVPDETVRCMLLDPGYRILHSRKKVLLKRTILKSSINLPIKLPKCWLRNSGKKVFNSKLMTLGFSISTTLMTRSVHTNYGITIKKWRLTTSLHC